jgi:hypothetical protein
LGTYTEKRDVEPIICFDFIEQDSLMLMSVEAAHKCAQQA